MTLRIPDQLLQQLSEFIVRHFGLFFPEARWRDLAQKIAHAARDFDFTDPQEFITWLMTTPLTRVQDDTLVNHLTVGETYFFREPKSFDILEQQLLPELIRSRRGTNQQLRIWCAGCSSGEEPYSIAILLTKLLPDLDQWQISILATDINPHSLTKASQGVYNDWSFRGVSLWVKNQFFTPLPDGRRAIIPAIKNMVTFTRLNLVRDLFPALPTTPRGLDFIFCRNVLMYFEQEQMRRVIHHFHGALAEGGWLIVSPSEVSHNLYLPFETVSFTDAVFYRKNSSHQTVVPLLLEPLDLPLAVPAEPLLMTELPLAGSREPAVSSRPLLRAEHNPEPSAETTEVPEETTLSVARTLANQGRLAEAQLLVEQSLAADRLNPEAHYLYATIREEQGAVDEAVAALRKSLYLDQDFVLAHFSLAHLLQRQGKRREASRHFTNTRALLEQYRLDDLLPGAEGMTAGRLAETIATARTGKP